MDPAAQRRSLFLNGSPTLMLWLILCALVVWMFVYCSVEKGRLVNAWQAENAAVQMEGLLQGERRLRHERTDLEVEIQQHRSTPEISQRLQANQSEMDRIQGEQEELRKKIEAYRTSIFTTHP